MTAPLNLDALQALCDAATPGEWLWDGNDIVRVYPSPTKRHPNRVSRQYVVQGAADDFSGDGYVVVDDEDAAFITAARSALPALIQEVRLLEAKLFNADHDLERLRDDNAELRRKNLALYQSLAGFTGNA